MQMIPVNVVRSFVVLNNMVLSVVVALLYLTYFCILAIFHLEPDNTLEELSWHNSVVAPVCLQIVLAITNEKHKQSKHNKITDEVCSSVVKETSTTNVSGSILSANNSMQGQDNLISLFKYTTKTKKKVSFCNEVECILCAETATILKQTKLLNTDESKKYFRILRKSTRRGTRSALSEVIRALEYSKRSRCLNSKQR
jgi:hypothetical protein